MASLSQHIAAELENIRETIAQIPSGTKLDSLKTLELIGVATVVSNFYHGIENILKQVVIAKKLKIASDQRWHKNLLDLSLREGLIQQKTHGQLLKFLTFRHFYTHAYSIDVDPKKLLVLVKLVKPTLNTLVADLRKSGLYSPPS